MNKFRMIFPVLVVMCVAAITTMIPSRADGQVLIGLLLGDKVTSEKFHLGISVGANFSDLSGIDDTKIRSGFALSLIGEWRFAGQWYLQPELGAFYYAGANNMPMETFPPPPEVEDMVTGNEVTARLKYFTIPVVLKYGAMGNRLHLGAGGQVGFLTSSKLKYEGTSETGNEIEVEKNIKDITVSTDAGLVFHLEYRFKPGPLSTSIVARYYLGLTDTWKDNPGDPVYNRIFSIFINLPIGHLDEESVPDGS